MNIFNDFIEYENEIINSNWIEWDHFLVPNELGLLRNIIRSTLAVFGHCGICTSLDGCYLLNSNKPLQPLHPKCDCKKPYIAFEKVKNNSKAECNIEKFTKYIFSPIKVDNGKINIFKSLNYTIADSEQLKIEFEIQARNNYLKGNYKLKNLDDIGQRLAIPICLRNKKFYSGWMLEPEGHIRNTTPFGGWINE